MNQSQSIELTRANGAVLLEKQGGVAIITLNRPDRYNAVNQDLSDGLLEALVVCETDEEIRAIVLAGNGRGFSAGADMSGFVQDGVKPENVGDYIKMNYGPIVQKICIIPKPIIAAINGSVAGVGISFALAADFRVMEPQSNIRFAFINIGLGPDGGCSWLLARQVGYSRALQIAVEGEKIYGEECYRLGLTNKLVEEGKLMEETLAWAHRLAERPTLAVGITKRVMHYNANNSLRDAIYFEAEQQVQAIKSEDHKMGVMSFISKQKPVFKGK